MHQMHLHLSGFTSCLRGGGSTLGEQENSIRASMVEQSRADLPDLGGFAKTPGIGEGQAGAKLIEQLAG
jgi:hypothetical protein